MCAASDTSGELLFVTSSLLSVILLEVSMWLTPPRLLQDVAAALLVLDVTSATSLSPFFIIIIDYYYHYTRHSFCLSHDDVHVQPVRQAIVGHTVHSISSVGLKQLMKELLRTPAGLVQCLFEFIYPPLMQYPMPLYFRYFVIYPFCYFEFLLSFIFAWFWVYLFDLLLFCLVSAVIGVLNFYIHYINTQYGPISSLIHLSSITQQVAMF